MCDTFLFSTTFNTKESRSWRRNVRGEKPKTRLSHEIKGCQKAAEGYREWDTGWRDSTGPTKIQKLRGANESWGGFAPANHNVVSTGHMKLQLGRKYWTQIQRNLWGPQTDPSDSIPIFYYPSVCPQVPLTFMHHDRLSKRKNTYKVHYHIIALITIPNHRKKETQVVICAGFYRVTWSGVWTHGAHYLQVANFLPLQKQKLEFPVKLLFRVLPCGAREQKGTADRLLFPGSKSQFAFKALWFSVTALSLPVHAPKFLSSHWNKAFTSTLPYICQLTITLTTT